MENNNLQSVIIEKLEHTKNTENTKNNDNDNNTKYIQGITLLENNNVEDINNIIKEKVEYKTNLAYIQRRINSMNLESMSQIYKIINDHNEKYTETKTDILINLGNLSNNCINNISKFIEYLDSNQELLLRDEIEKNDYKKHISK